MPTPIESFHQIGADSTTPVLDAMHANPHLILSSDRHLPDHTGTCRHEQQPALPLVTQTHTGTRAHDRAQWDQATHHSFVQLLAARTSVAATKAAEPHRVHVETEQQIKSVKQIIEATEQMLEAIDDLLARLEVSIARYSQGGGHR